MLEVGGCLGSSFGEHNNADLLIRRQPLLHQLEAWDAWVHRLKIFILSVTAKDLSEHPLCSCIMHEAVSHPQLESGAPSCKCWHLAALLHSVKRDFHPIMTALRVAQECVAFRSFW